MGKYNSHTNFKGSLRKSFKMVWTPHSNTYNYGGKMVMFKNSEGKISRGRPKTRWRGCIKKNLKSTNLVGDEH